MCPSGQQGLASGHERIGFLSRNPRAMAPSPLDLLHGDIKLNEWSSNVYSPYACCDVFQVPDEN